MIETVNMNVKLARGFHSIIRENFKPMCRWRFLEIQFFLNSFLTTHSTNKINVHVNP